MKKLKVALLFLGFTICGSAMAQDISSYYSAKKLFVLRVEQLKKTKEMPMLSNKEDVETITTLSNSAVFLESSNFDAKNLNELDDLCNLANQNVMAYVLFDLESHVDPNMPQDEIVLQVKRVMYQNNQTYQHELERLQPFLLRCIAKEVPFLTQFIKELKPEEFTAVRKSGLNKMRLSAAKMYQVWIMVLNDESLGTSYKKALLTALSDTANEYRDVMKLADRKSVIDAINGLPVTISYQYLSYLQKITQAMSDMTCKDLCALE